MPVDASQSLFPRLRPVQIRALRNRLQPLIRDAGHTDLSSEVATSSAEPFWQLEPSPLVVDSTEWSRLHDAITQRARAVNAFLVDVYHRQEMLRARLLPPEVILTDPYYRRPCLNLEPPRESPATLLRFDLIKTEQGWHFTDTRANTPVGLSFAVQNRRFLTQEAGALYGALPEYHSIINFPLQLLDALHQLSPRPADQTSVVVLTSGPRDPFYSEHSFLARKMGLPLARGDDLLVLDNCLYFKTIAGLERVDVIYRRLNDAHIDPVVFSTDRESVGIPGLLQCIRSRNVVVANAIGCGLAESRALEAYWPRLMRFYIGEKPLLPSIPTFTCGDNDHLEAILDTPSAFRVRPTHDPKLGDPGLDSSAPFVGPNGLSHTVLENPYQFVAQKIIAPQPLPTADAKRFPGFSFSAFVLCQGRHFSVLPGGIVHLGSIETPLDRVGVSADAIVLQDTTGDRVSADLEPPAINAPRNALGSRAAENLFWLGRYIERAEATGRMQSIFGDVALEEIPARDRRRWIPVWRGLFEATGHTQEKIAPRANPQTALSADLAWRMALDRTHPSSIFSSVSVACENARQLRDYVSPEAWSVLHRLQTRLAGLHRADTRARAAEPGNDEPRRKNARLAIEFALSDLNAFLGTADRTMLHDAGWHFLRMGVHLERATMTCSSLRHILGALDAAASSSPAAPAPVRRDNPELSALLRMLGSQDAYRRLYQTHSQPRFVAELFLRQPDAPRSIFFNLDQIKHCLRAIQLDLRADEEPAALAVSENLQFLAALPLDRHFNDGSAATDEAKPEKFSNLLSDLLGRLYALHPLLSDHYFSHQARLPAVAQVEFKI